ncbi:hypothetical protein BJ165DRAFT_1127003 [Panaeolus papilionaceus]|nr:hypothetical protein BJ165DRAFT_1127003 [Panaeolus papilionaceus]
MKMRFLPRLTTYFEALTAVVIVCKLVPAIVDKCTWWWRCLRCGLRAGRLGAGIDGVALDGGCQMIGLLMGLDAGMDGGPQATHGATLPLSTKYNEGSITT